MSILMFPGQGSQFVGMGKELYDTNAEAREWFEKADAILGFPLSRTMFEGSEEDLKKTSVTQPAVFLHAFVSYRVHAKEIEAKAVAGHSLGEFTALVANGALDFEDGLKLVYERAQAMQEACDQNKGTMAAILGLDDEVVESICASTDGIVVPANYNCPGQLVVSGELSAVEKMVEAAKEKGARRALVLNVDGAFHSPLMKPAQERLAAAIRNTRFNEPRMPVYQNVSAKAESAADTIKSNLIKQLTHSVMWTQMMKAMSEDGHKHYVEFGAKVLSGFLRRFDRSLSVEQF